MSTETLPDTDEVVDLSMFDGDVDHEAIDQAKKDSQPPAGGYTTEPALSMSFYKAGDGRRIVNFFGTIVSDKDGSSHKVRFRMSPDRRDKKDDPGKPDIATRLWAASRDAYKAALGEDPTNNTEIVNYVANYPVVLRLMQGDDSPIVLSVRAPR